MKSSRTRGHGGQRAERTASPAARSRGARLGAGDGTWSRAGPAGRRRGGTLRRRAGRRRGPGPRPATSRAERAPAGRPASAAAISPASASRSRGAGSAGRGGVAGVAAPRSSARRRRARTRTRFGPTPAAAPSWRPCRSSDVHLGRVAEEHGGQDQVLQLAHVAGPRVGLERLLGPRREVVGRPAIEGGELLQEDVRQVDDVVLALAQRRHVEADDVQAMEEVLAEPALGHLGAQVRRWWRR